MQPTTRAADDEAASPVRKLRTEAGLSQQALATKAGVAIRTLVRIEQGEDTRVATLTAIADALSVPVADLLSPAPTDVEATR